MTVADSKPTDQEQPGRRRRLGVSRYDRAASMLIALLILLGLTVLGMAALWLTHHIIPSQKEGRIEVAELKKSDEPPVGPGSDIEPPPLLDTDLVEEPVDDALENVTDAHAVEAAHLAQRVSGDGVGIGGQGPSRHRTGPAQPQRRWQLRFTEGNSLETYAAQLDFFKIELGVLRPENRIQYISGLSHSRPIVREDVRDKESRYRFTWTQGTLEQADRLLLERASIEVDNGAIYKFLPEELENRLVQLESGAAAGKKVRSTVFAIKSTKDGYEFYVLRQSYRDS